MPATHLHSPPQVGIALPQQPGAQHPGERHVHVRGQAHPGVSQIGDDGLLQLQLLPPPLLQEAREGEGAGAEAVVVVLLL